jgi:hypothetical protein
MRASRERDDLSDVALEVLLKSLSTARPADDAWCSDDECILAVDGRS